MIARSTLRRLRVSRLVCRRFAAAPAGWMAKPPRELEKSFRNQTKSSNQHTEISAGDAANYIDEVLAGVLVQEDPTYAGQLFGSNYLLLITVDSHQEGDNLEEQNSKNESDRISDGLLFRIAKEISILLQDPPGDLKHKDLQKRVQRLLTLIKVIGSIHPNRFSYIGLSKMIDWFSEHRADLIRIRKTEEVYVQLTSFFNQIISVSYFMVLKTDPLQDTEQHKQLLSSLKKLLQLQLNTTTVMVEFRLLATLSFIHSGMRIQNKHECADLELLIHRLAWKLEEKFASAKFEWTEYTLRDLTGLMTNCTEMIYRGSTFPFKIGKAILDKVASEHIEKEQLLKHETIIPFLLIHCGYLTKQHPLAQTTRALKEIAENLVGERLYQFKLSQGIDFFRRAIELVVGLKAIGGLDISLLKKVWSQIEENKSLLVAPLLVKSSSDMSFLTYFCQITLQFSERGSEDGISPFTTILSMIMANNNIPLETRSLSELLDTIIRKIKEKRINRNLDEDDEWFVIPVSSLFKRIKEELLTKIDPDTPKILEIYQAYIAWGHPRIEDLEGILVKSKKPLERAFRMISLNDAAYNKKTQAALDLIKLTTAELQQEFQAIFVVPSVLHLRVVSDFFSDCIRCCNLLAGSSRVDRVESPNWKWLIQVFEDILLEVLENKGNKYQLIYENKKTGQSLLQFVNIFIKVAQKSQPASRRLVDVAFNLMRTGTGYSQQREQLLLFSAVFIGVVKSSNTVFTAEYLKEIDEFLCSIKIDIHEASQSLLKVLKETDGLPGLEKRLAQELIAQPPNFQRLDSMTGLTILNSAIYCYYDNTEVMYMLLKSANRVGTEILDNLNSRNGKARKNQSEIHLTIIKVIHSGLQLPELAMVGKERDIFFSTVDTWLKTNRPPYRYQKKGLFSFSNLQRKTESVLMELNKEYSIEKDIGGFQVDFIVGDNKVLEVVGPSHFNEQMVLNRSTRFRDKVLRNLGYKVYYITNDDLGGTSNLKKARLTKIFRCNPNSNIVRISIQNKLTADDLRLEAHADFNSLPSEDPIFDFEDPQFIPLDPIVQKEPLPETPAETMPEAPKEPAKKTRRKLKATQ